MDGEVVERVSCTLFIKVPKLPEELMMMFVELVAVKIEYEHVPFPKVIVDVLDVVAVSKITWSASSAHAVARILACPDCCKLKSVFELVTPCAITDTIIRVPSTPIKITDMSAIYPSCL
jgi:hypothetical protein